MKIPEYVSYESTLTCNLRCTHCGLGCTVANDNELNTLAAKLMIKKISLWGVPNFIFSGGEFTMRNDWQELLAYALRQNSKSVRLVSNGFQGKKLLEGLEQLLAQEKIILSISVDGLKKIHNARRGQGSFEKLSQILGSPTNIFKSVITTFGRDNFWQLFLLFWQNLKWRVSIWSIQTGLPAGRMVRKNFLGLSRLKFLANVVYILQKVAKNRMTIITDDCSAYQHRVKKNNPWQGCPAGKRLMTILADGSITGCPTWTEIFGNVKNTALKEAWKNISRYTLRAIPSQCQKCGRCAGGCKTVDKIFNHQFCF